MIGFGLQVAGVGVDEGEANILGVDIQVLQIPARTRETGDWTLIGGRLGAEMPVAGVGRGTGSGEGPPRRCRTGDVAVGVPAVLHGDGGGRGGAGAAAAALKGEDGSRGGGRSAEGRGEEQGRRRRKGCEGEWGNERVGEVRDRVGHGERSNN